MGFYLRKSIRVGLFRFNFSKSGIEISTGIKGFRLGTGPRGNYVHLGRQGFYFRKTLSPNVSTNTTYTLDKHPANSGQASNYVPGGAKNLRENESANVQQMVDSSSKELLDEINIKQRKIRLLHFALAFTLLVFIALFYMNAPLWAVFTTLIMALPFLYLAQNLDIMAKSVVIFYDLEDIVKDTYAKFHEQFDKVAACISVWHLEGTGDVIEPKSQVGAGGVISRKNILLSKGRIPIIKTNINIPQIPVGKRVMAFMPDRLLVFEPKAVRAIPYDNLEIQIEEQPFVEDKDVPSDSQIIDHTWKFVNKKGGPDKRFANNSKIPIVLYERLHFNGSSGLNETIQLSKVGFGQNFSAAIDELAIVNKTYARPIEKPIVANGLLKDEEELWVSKGIESYKTGQFDQALTAFTHTIEINSKNVLAYFNRGCVHNKLGNGTQAINDLKIAASYGHPKSQDILKSKGISWLG